MIRLTGNLYGHIRNKSKTIMLNDMDSLEISRLKLAMIHSTKNSNLNSFCNLTQCNREMSKRIVTGWRIQYSIRRCVWIFKFFFHRHRFDTIIINKHLKTRPRIYLIVFLNQVQAPLYYYQLDYYSHFFWPLKIYYFYGGMCILFCYN